MNTAILILVPLSLVLLAVAVWAFFWAADGGQFDDLDAPAWKIILDDDMEPPDPDAPNDRGSGSASRDRASQKRSHGENQR